MSNETPVLAQLMMDRSDPIGNSVDSSGRRALHVKADINGGMVITVVVNGLGSTGKLGIFTASDTIPNDQIYNIANATTPISLTLPAIADINTGGATSAFNIKNVTSHVVTLVPNGADTIEFDTTLKLKYADGSVTIIATSLGWMVI